MDVFASRIRRAKYHSYCFLLPLPAGLIASVSPLHYWPDAANSNLSYIAHAISPHGQDAFNKAEYSFLAM